MALRRQLRQLAKEPKLLVTLKGLPENPLGVEGLSIGADNWDVHSDALLTDGQMALGYGKTKRKARGPVGGADGPLAKKLSEASFPEALIGISQLKGARVNGLPTLSFAPHTEAHVTINVRALPS